MTYNSPGSDKNASHKENYDEEFRSLKCNRKARPRLSVRETLKPLYNQKILITKEKYNDLMSLFTMTPPALPNEYRSFYEYLPFQGRRPQDESDLSDNDFL